MSERCKVCQNRVRKAGVNAALAAGISAAQISRDQTNTGWPVTDATISRHAKHYVAPIAVTNPGATGRNLAILLRDQMFDHVQDILEADRERDERYGEDNPDGDMFRVPLLMNKDLQPALKTGLAAEKELYAREQKRDTLKVKVELAILLSGAPPPMALVGDGTIIEGTAEEIADDGPDFDGFEAEDDGFNGYNAG